MPSVTTPSTPDPTLQQNILLIIRTGLKVLASFGIAYGAAVTDAQWALISGFIAMVVEMGVSYWTMKHQAWLDHLGNLASARAGSATRVVAEKGSITDVS